MHIFAHLGRMGGLLLLLTMASCSTTENFILKPGHYSMFDDADSKTAKAIEDAEQNASVQLFIRGKETFTYCTPINGETKGNVTIESLRELLELEPHRRMAYVTREQLGGDVKYDNAVIKVLIDYGFDTIIISPGTSFDIWVESVIYDGAWKEGTCIDFNASPLSNSLSPTRPKTHLDKSNE